MYGKGAYFATTADASHGYGPPDSNGIYTMLLSKLITGKSHLGSEHLVGPWKGYDSTRNGDGSYMFIYDMYRILPLAIIEYNMLI